MGMMVLKKSRLPWHEQEVQEMVWPWVSMVTLFSAWPVAANARLKNVIKKKVVSFFIFRSFHDSDGRRVLPTKKELLGQIHPQRLPLFG